MVRQEIRRKRCSDSRARRFGVARHPEAEQAARERANRVASGTAAKVEHKCHVTSKSDFRRRPLDLLDQACLSDPGFTAHVEGLAAPGLATRCQRRPQQSEFTAATDKRPPLARNRP